MWDYVNDVDSLTTDWIVVFCCSPSAMTCLEGSTRTSILIPIYITRHAQILQHATEAAALSHHCRIIGCIVLDRIFVFSLLLWLSYFVDCLQVLSWAICMGQSWKANQRWHCSLSLSSMPLVTKQICTRCAFSCKSIICVCCFVGVQLAMPFLACLSPILFTIRLASRVSI